MNLQVPPELEAKLIRLAAETGRTVDQVALEARIYWSAIGCGPEGAWFYNFGKGAQSFGRHEDGEKLRVLSVRCVKD